MALLLIMIDCTNSNSCSTTHSDSYVGNDERLKVQKYKREQSSQLILLFFKSIFFLSLIYHPNCRSTNKIIIGHINDFQMF